MINKKKIFSFVIGLFISLSSLGSVASPAYKSIYIPSSNNVNALFLESIKSYPIKKNSGRRSKSNVPKETTLKTKNEIMAAITSSGFKEAKKNYRQGPLITEAQQNNIRKLSKKNQGDAVVRVFFNESHGVPEFVGIKAQDVKGVATQLLQTDMSTMVSNFLNSNKDLLKITSPSEELRGVGRKVDNLGLSHFRYQQQYNGVPIYGSELIVHVDKQSNVYMLNGKTRPTPKNINTSPQITSDNAVSITRKHLELNIEESVASSLVLRPRGDNQLDLVYLVDIKPSIAERWLYFVSAESGEIVHRINNIQHAGSIVNASGVDEQGQTRAFNAWFESATYFMIDPSTPLTSSSYDPLVLGPNNSGDTFILDAQNGDGSSLFYSESLSLNSNWDSAAVSAMFNTRVVYDYYKQVHGRNSIDNNDQNLMSAIHFQTNYNNAFWNGSFMVFGDGDGVVFSSLAGCLDIAGHEMTHGVIENSAALIYENQSGALNESFADVFGAMVDDSNWTLGEDCTVASPGYLRNMQNPALGLSSQPTKMSEYQNLPNTESGDNGGVHINSGIPNRAAYLLTEGLTPEGLGTSIGRVKAEKIYYRALTIYLTASAQFIDARRALIQSAEDLYGVSSPESIAVGLSWDAVEVVEGGGSGPSDTAPTSTDEVAGTEAMVYLYPQDGTHDDSSEPFDVYRQVMGSPFAGYEAAKDYGPLNIGIDAAYTKPAAYTDADENLILFVGVDSNLYMVDDLVSPVLANVTQITTTNDVYSITISPDGRYFAYTSTSLVDNAIHVIDVVEGSSFDVPIVPQNYQDGSSQGVDAIFYADSLSFDYTSNVIVFDALFCQSTPTSTCNLNGGGYQYWSIGLLSLDTRSFFYPVPNQGLEFDLGYPSFATNNNFIIAFDVHEFTSSDVNSSVLIGNLETTDITSVVDFGAGAFPFYSIPSFWGGDNFVTTQVSVGTSEAVTAFRVPIDTNWLGDPALATRLNDFAVAMPIMHREGERILTGALQASSSLLDFGIVEIGVTKVLNLTVTNAGNSDVDVSNISLHGTEYSHNATNTRIPRQSSITIRVSYTPTTTGTQTSTLVLNYDNSSVLNVSLTGVDNVVVPPPPDTSTNDSAPVSSGGGGGGSVSLLGMALFGLIGFARRKKV